MKDPSVTVFCGSRSGDDPLYELHATQLGELLAKRNIRMVYGGGNKGIMGALANSMLANKGHVIGIIPKILTEWEQQHESLTELIITDGMHERKKMMYEMCDAAIILPGGFGTLDELFEMLTWNQLNIHNKKIHLLNTANFFNHLINHLFQLQSRGFLYDPVLARIRISPTPEELIDKLEL